MPLVFLRDRDDEPEVRVDHPLLRRRVASLDRLRKLDLLRCGQQRVAAGLVQEELERVGRHRGDLAVHVRRLVDLRQRAIVGELDSARLDLLVQTVELVVVELELLDESREGRHVDAADLLAVLHQDAQLVVAHSLIIP